MKIRTYSGYERRCKMAHIHDVYDQDNHFVIDPITRDITSQSEKISITQYDHNSERFTFEIPKIIEGHDMSLSDKVRVHFINIGSNRSNVSKGVYEVDDIRVSSDDSDTLLFSWLISRAATKYSGKLNFSIRFYCISDDNIVDYSWATSIFTGIKISNSIDNSEAIAEDYVDVLEQWKSEITMKIDDIDSKIENIEIPDIPTALPNPQSLTFTGAAEGTYDGSSALTVDIPSAPEIPTKLPNPQSLTFTGAVNASYDGSSEVSVEISDAYGAKETVIFSLDSVTFVDNEDGKMEASIDMPMPFTESGIYKVKIGNRSGIAGILQKDIDDWNDNYNKYGEYIDIDLWDIFRDEKNLNESFPDGFYYNNTTLTLYDDSIEAGEYHVSITKVDAYPSIKMDKVNPTSIGSFSLNRKPGSTIGAYSHAEGQSTTASGYASHAEGAYTTASSSCSHAEGSNNTASGEASHAEGYITTASGKNSHAEGQVTTAKSENQHVQGKYNIEDSSGFYADIIGNGTASKKSNAATVDWHGNAWYAGDVYVGSTNGTNKDEGSKKLATEEYVDNSTASIDIPTALPNPQSLTFTGAAEGTYDGSSALTVDIPSAPEIPTKLPNPQSLTFTGAAEGTYDGSSALTVDIPSAPEIPTALPNPKSLTFTGGVNASYDGSSEVSVEIPGALSGLSEDATHRVVTDAEKAKWNAKSNFSGSYNDLTDKPTIPDVPVQSVNGKTGAVVLSAEDVGALPGSTVIPEALPNPNALTFAGAVNATYDGSSAVTVEIPDGAGAWYVTLTPDDNGNIIADKTMEEIEAAYQAGYAVYCIFLLFVILAAIPIIVPLTIHRANEQYTFCGVGTFDGKLYSFQFELTKSGWTVLQKEIPQKSDIPSMLPNPHAITFTGAVTGTYDGSAPLSVKIPTVDDVLAALPAWEGGSY